MQIQSSPLGAQDAPAPEVDLGTGPQRMDGDDDMGIPLGSDQVMETDAAQVGRKRVASDMDGEEQTQAKSQRLGLSTPEAEFDVSELFHHPAWH